MNRSPRTHALATAVSGIVVVLLWATTGCSGLGPTPADSPLATPISDLIATSRAAKQIAQQLEATWLSRTAMPETKQTARAIGTGVAATLAASTPEPTVFPAIPGTPAGAGTIVEAIGPFSSYVYSIKGRWYEDTQGGSVRTTVWAGAVAAPGGGASPKGMVLVEVHRRYVNSNITKTELVESVQRLTPCQGGPVRVVGATGEVLTLLSTSGHTFYFDVPTRQFVPPPAASPTPTPNPAHDWVFSGSVDIGTGEPPPCASLTLYRQVGTTWQPLAQATPSANGTFTLSAPGPRPPSRFLLTVQYPPGFAPELAVAGPGFVVVDNHTLLSVSALGPGEYGGQRFRGIPAPPLPGTPTPPPLPTPPTGVSPLATPMP